MGLTADACSFVCRDDRQNSGLSILRHLRSRLIIYRNKKIAISLDSRSAGHSG